MTTAVASRVCVLYRLIASTLEARDNCQKANPQNVEWFHKHDDLLHTIESNLLPSGSGIDNGTRITDYKRGKRGLESFTLEFGFHHMDENGMYDGWTDYKCVVRPSFDGIDIRITGENRNQIKDYLYDVFYDILTRQVSHDADGNVELASFDRPPEDNRPPCAFCN